MNILILSAPNPKKTAGIVAFDLYKGLETVNGTDVRLIVKQYGNYYDKKIIPIDSYLTHYREAIIQKFATLSIRVRSIRDPSFKIVNSDYVITDYDPTRSYCKTSRLLSKIDFTPDAIIVLFNHKFLSFKNLWELNAMTKAPIYIYPMDMSPMTAGCHYAWDCKGYHNQCGFCPAYCSSAENDQSRKNWLFKKRYIDKTNISVLYVNEHLHQQILQSSLFKGKRKYKVPLGIDATIFKLGDMSRARNIFKLPLNKKIVFIGAANVNSKRKGYRQLIDALKILKQNLDNPSNIHIAVAGRHNNDLQANWPFDYSTLGYLTYDQLAAAFRSADLFLCPSIEDSGPMMINQSIMCGTPVVAFETGAALDHVITGKTGYLAIMKDCHDFAKGVKSILDLNAEDRKIMRKNCWEHGIEFCHPKVQANKIYEALLDN
jgi:glycosyltransferase involved in cell wall biosynthesis